MRSDGVDEATEAAARNDSRTIYKCMQKLRQPKIKPPSGITLEDAISHGYQTVKRVGLYGMENAWRIVLCRAEQIHSPP